MSAKQPETSSRDIYRHALEVLNGARVPYLVGGAFAFHRYSGISRLTKDFDLFLKKDDFSTAATTLREGGFHTERTYSHWLGKAFIGDEFVDLIFGGGNGEARVDDLWFRHASDDVLFGEPVKVAPPEEIIWSKAFVMERERFDGADVAHLFLACAHELDWRRLIDRFDEHWRVLYAQLVLFGFIYPSEQSRIPRWVMDELTGRLQREISVNARAERICRGTLLSRAQYLVDVDERGFLDGRLTPFGSMSAEEIERWTAAIEET
ncbi:MAG: hypothetical protein WBX15_07340 [Thermoanaerobaculia bacterium]